MNEYSGLRARVFLRLMCLILAFCLCGSLSPGVMADDGAPEEFLYGDLNADQTLGVEDLTLLAKHVSGWTDPGVFCFSAGDLYYDEVLDLSDLALLAKLIAGWDLDLPIMPERTIWVIGDSTADQYYIWKNGEKVVQTQSDGRDLMGWGYYLSSYFGEHVKVYNGGSSGDSSISYAGIKSGTARAKYETILQESKPGDWVVIQFGHNDENRKDDYSDSGSLVPDPAHGIDFDWHDADERTCLIDGLDRPSFQAALYYYYVRPLREKGVFVVLASPITRFVSDQTRANFGNPNYSKHVPYANALQDLALECDLPYLPMMETTVEYLTRAKAERGAYAAASLYAFENDARVTYDGTHPSHYGAYVLAGLYADALCERIPWLNQSKRAVPTPFDGVIPAVWAQ